MDEEKKLPELSENGKKVLEIVEKMTVLELADLVKVMEDKFGVSAAAPVAAVAVAAAPARVVDALKSDVLKSVNASAPPPEIVKPCAILSTPPTKSVILSIP